MIDVTLPLPPSVNNLYLTTLQGRRIKSPQYRRWIKAAGTWVMVQRPRPIVGPVLFTLIIAHGARGDTDNRLKAAQDLFTSLGLTSDDAMHGGSMCLRSHIVAPDEARVVIHPAVASTGVLSTLLATRPGAAPDDGAAARTPVARSEASDRGEAAST